ncbi:alpha/beta hydrolase [Ferrigenium sp. UT5]|uniref:alpha/beta hydrolase n=1 Tax=Ferrigenium sp. UT5 TaxID=3242105 RepID=UPI00355059E5
MSHVLPHITLNSGANPRFSVIWLHGLGASGEDFVPVAQELHLPQAVRFIFPHAPARPVTINGGHVMPAWYDIGSSEIDAEQDAAGIAATRHEIEKLIAREVGRGIAPGHLFVAGFSQGGAIALHTGLHAQEKLGGILALSTYLPLADTTRAAGVRRALGTPIFMAHGLHDPVLPCALGKQSAARLQHLGFTPDWHDYAMPHSVCMEEIRDIERWLRKQMEIAENPEKPSG